MRGFMNVFLLLLGFVLLGGMACSPEPVKEIPHPDYLRLTGGEPNTIDPHLVTDAGSHAYVGKLFGGLVRLESAFFDEKGALVASGGDITDDMIAKFQKGAYRASAIVVPDIAKEIPKPEYNKDGTVSYTFVLREDAKFSNGRPVTAWDFAYSLDRIADPRTFSTTAELYVGDIVGVMEMQRGVIPNRVSPDPDTVFVDLPGVQVIDKQTIRLTIVGPRHDFLAKLTYPAAFVVDKVQVTSGAKWTDRPNGTGPYVLVKRDVGEMVLEANQYYYGRKPRISKVMYYLSGGSSYPRFQAGELDVAGIGVADLDLLAQVRSSSSDLNKHYYETVDMSTSYIGLNMRRPPFDDPNVRRALAMSIDREALSRDVFHDLVVPAFGILPPGMPGHRADYKGVQYDPVAAKKLLDESKYARNMPRIKIMTSGSGSAPGIVLQSIVEFWRSNLGIEVEIEQIDYATFLDELRKGNFQMFSLGWIADYPDPGNFLDLKFYSQRSIANNETGYKNAQVDKLLEGAREEADEAKRIALYQQVETLIMGDMPWIPLFYSKDSVLVKPYVCGYYPAPMGISILASVNFCAQK